MREKKTLSGGKGINSRKIVTVGTISMDARQIESRNCPDTEWKLWAKSSRIDHEVG